MNEKFKYLNIRTISKHRISEESDHSLFEGLNFTRNERFSIVSINNAKLQKTKRKPDHFQIFVLVRKAIANRN